MSPRIVSLHHTRWSQTFGWPSRDRADGKIANDTTSALAEMLMLAAAAAGTKARDLHNFGALCALAAVRQGRYPHNVVDLEGHRLFRDSFKRLEERA